MGFEYKSILINKQDYNQLDYNLEKLNEFLKKEDRYLILNDGMHISGQLRSNRSFWDDDFLLECKDHYLYLIIHSWDQIERQQLIDLIIHFYTQNKIQLSFEAL